MSQSALLDNVHIFDEHNARLLDGDYLEYLNLYRAWFDGQDSRNVQKAADT